MWKRKQSRSAFDTPYLTKLSSVQLWTPPKPTSQLRLANLRSVRGQHTAAHKAAKERTRRYRLSILLSPTHRAAYPGTRLSRIPAIPDRQPCKHFADQSCPSVFNSSGASQLFGVSFSPSEKIVDTTAFLVRALSVQCGRPSHRMYSVSSGSLLCSD